MSEHGKDRVVSAGRSSNGDSMKAFSRARPVVSEATGMGLCTCFEVDKDRKTVVKHPKSDRKVCTFDEVADKTVTQEREMALENITAEREELRRRNEELEATCQNLEEQLWKETVTSRDATNRHQQMISESQNAYLMMQEMYQSTISEVDDLRTQLDSKLQQNSVLTEKQRMLVNENGALKSQKEKLQSRLNDCEARLQVMQSVKQELLKKDSKLAEHVADKQLLQKRSVELDQKLSSLQEAFDVVTGQLDVYKKNSVDRTEMAEELRRTKQQLIRQEAALMRIHKAKNEVDSKGKLLEQKQEGVALKPPTAKTEPIEKQKCTDLIVLGLPRNCAEDDLIAHFSQFGELIMVQVKRERQTNHCNGFGFIRFTDYESQLKALSQRHLIHNLWCDIRIPNSKESAQLGRHKVYVGVHVSRPNPLTTDEEIEAGRCFGGGRIADAGRGKSAGSAFSNGCDIGGSQFQLNPAVLAAAQAAFNHAMQCMNHGGPGGCGGGFGPGVAQPGGRSGYRCQMGSDDTHTASGGYRPPAPGRN